MTSDISFRYLLAYVTQAKILARLRDHVRQFYGNCRTLYEIKDVKELSLMK